MLKNLHSSDVMDFHFQLYKTHSCETVGKGVSITRVNISKNCVACTVTQC